MWCSGLFWFSSRWYIWIFKFRKYLYSFFFKDIRTAWMGLRSLAKVCRWFKRDFQGINQSFAFTKIFNLKFLGQYFDIWAILCYWYQHIIFDLLIPCISCLKKKMSPFKRTFLTFFNINTKYHKNWKKCIYKRNKNISFPHSKKASHVPFYD